MDKQLYTTITTYQDILSEGSTNLCRFEHILRGENNILRLDDVYMTEPCYLCDHRLGDRCLIGRYNIKVR